VRSIFTYTDREVISKCGLDGYFFLRYLQTLLVIFVPLACLILPILLPINYIGGIGSGFATSSNSTNVTGVDTVAWGNVSPSHTSRYWAHLVLAIVVVVWVCYVFFAELKVYIRVRQDYLTSPEHRLKASATTVLVGAIPKKWLTEKALMGLYDVFPGGIRNIWINRNYDELLNKVHYRDAVRGQLELAETQLIQKCKLVQMKKAAQEERKIARKTGAKQLTKEEREQRQKAADGEADRMAHEGGVSSGDPHQVQHNVEDAVEEEEEEEARSGESGPERSRLKVPIIGGIGQGLGRGLGAFGNQIGKAGQTLVGGAREFGRDVSEQFGTTNGFVVIDSPPTPAAAKFEPDPPRSTGLRVVDTATEDSSAREDNRAATVADYSSRTEETGRSTTTAYSDARELGTGRTTTKTELHQTNSRFGGDGTREIENGSDNWLRFWRGPAVGYPSPTPHGFEDDEYPLEHKNSQVGGATMPKDSVTDGSYRRRQQRPTTMDKIKGWVQSVSKKSPVETIEYPLAYNQDYKEDVPGGALWGKYIKESDRPSHRVARFSWTPDFLPSLPFISPKVDTIYWCREHLARLNVEIEEDQKHPERYPLMNSAFIQFNHQVAAHMASQAVSHHIPKQMAPRLVEVSPTDVIWDNMSIKWWEAWFRTALILAIVAGMTILWAIPVSGTALLGDLPALINRVPWLQFLNDNNVVRSIFQALGGVLPALALTILLAIVPLIFYTLAGLQGVQTGMMRELAVQNYLFFFHFVQIFLVVSIASGALHTLSATANDIASIPMTLAQNLPLAADYFFSYMILQALGNSSGALLQYVTLALWYILPKLFDNTARDKWNRNTTLSVVSWGSYFPLYTTFACIALVYSVIAPLILIFAIITFGLYWIANRYCMLYIFKVKEDTGGLLYPRAINQTFMGLYFMELCMVGLFFLVRDANNKVACLPQAIVMIVITGLTLLYQILLNQSFSPLFRHLPITLEDDAVIRDEAFARAQAARFSDDYDEEDEEYERAKLRQGRRDVREDEDIEMRKIFRATTNPDERHYNRFDPRRGIQGATTLAARGTAAIRSKTFGRYHGDPTMMRRRKRHRDLEAQQKMGALLFGAVDDELEDLTPRERDVLVNHAFKHEALRARRPAVWIPKDDLGISDEEVRRTEDYSNGNIWISNEGTALDSKAKVVYGRNPPDFSSVDLIRL
jgi:calcium permeable stress-gated cation channel